MVLLTHSVVGGALGGLLKSHPVSAFVVGFMSHFLLDAIPHWDYSLESSPSISREDKLKGDFVIDRRFFLDLIKIGTDLLSGLVITYVFIHGSVLDPWNFFSQGIFWGMVGGVLPDFLQFVYYKIKREPLTSLQKFHMWMHSSIDWHHRYILGPLFQLSIIVVTIMIYSDIH